MSSFSFTVSSHSQISEVEQDYTRLCGLSGGMASSFATVSAWYSTHAEKDGMDPVILKGLDETGQAVFLLPLVRKNYGPFKVLVRPAMKHLAYYSGVFCPEFQKQITGKNASSFWDIVLEGSGADALWIDGLAQSLENTTHPFSFLETFLSSNPCHLMALEDDWNAQYERITSTKSRGKDRRNRRHIEEHGTLACRMAESLDEKQQVMAEIIKQKEIQFIEMDVLDPFEEPHIRRFYHQLIELDHNSGNPSYQLYGMFLDDLMLGGVLGVRVGTTFHGMIFSRIVADIARHSPGRLMLLDLNEMLVGEGVKMHNFGTGFFEYKQKWCTGEEQRQHIIKAMNFKGEIFLQLLKVAAKLKRFIKQRQLQRHPVIGKLRTAFGV